MVRGCGNILVPMEILVLELDLAGERCYVLGYKDYNEVLHELRPDIVGGNNNEINEACVDRWVYFSDVIEKYGEGLFGDHSTERMIYEF